MAITTSKVALMRQKIEKKSFNLESLDPEQIGEPNECDEDSSLENFFEAEELKEKINEESSVPVGIFNAQVEVPSISIRKERTPSPPATETRTSSPKTPKSDASGRAVDDKKAFTIEVQLPEEKSFTVEVQSAEKKENKKDRDDDVPTSPNATFTPHAAEEEERKTRKKADSNEQSKPERRRRKKKASSKRSMDKFSSVMKAEDEDSIRSYTSGGHSESEYSLDDSTSGSSSASDSYSHTENPKAKAFRSGGRSQASKVSGNNLERIGSVLSESDTEVTTDGEGTQTTGGEGTLTDGERSYLSTLYDDEDRNVRPKTTPSSQRQNESDFLTNGPNLVDIELGDQTLIRYSASDLADAIRHNTYLKKLTLNQKDCDPLAFEILFEGIEESKYISHLEMYRVQITKETASEFVSSLSKNNSIRKLSLTKCKFVESGLGILFLGLQHNKSIKHLAIESSHLGRHQADIFSAAIPLMKLQSIRIQKTHMNGKGLRFLFQCIDKTPTLESINISEEMISVPLMKSLVESIRNSKTLLRLVVSDCGLDETCIEILAEGIEKNEVIEELDLSKNRFGNGGADILIDLLKRNNKIKGLQCGGCRISRTEREMLKDSIRYNNSFLKNMFSPDVTLSILDSVGFLQQGKPS
jgi:Ran GTPase-activating protein (RanGAP) involved in mRNA processing and transport